jgi:transmembrane sensor
VATQAKWLAADPRHAAEYARISRSWQKLDNIGAVPELLAMADAVEARARVRRARRPAWDAAAGFAAAAVIIGALWQIPRIVRSFGLTGPATRNYIVLASTARQMALPDGSIARMNGDSRIETNFTPAQREVRLVQGEVHFHVAKDPSRPFIVSAGRVTMQAIGTAFDVRLRADSVEVLVTEGNVHLGDSEHGSAQQSQTESSPDQASSKQALIVGERAVIQMVATASVPITIDTPSPTEIDQVLAWESTRLVFDRTPLNDVVDAFNNYNSRQLVLANPTLRNRTLSGVFRADNLDGFIHLLQASIDVIAEPIDGNRILLRAAP